MARHLKHWSLDVASKPLGLIASKLKRDTGQSVDRYVISAAIAAELIETATAWLLAIGTPITSPQTHPAGAIPAQS